MGEVLKLRKDVTFEDPDILKGFHLPSTLTHEEDAETFKELWKKIFAYTKLKTDSIVETDYVPEDPSDRIISSSIEPELEEKRHTDEKGSHMEFSERFFDKYLNAEFKRIDEKISANSELLKTTLNSISSQNQLIQSELLNTRKDLLEEVNEIKKENKSLKKWFIGVGFSVISLAIAFVAIVMDILQFNTQWLQAFLAAISHAQK